jgi:hypothetical protein
LTQIQKKAKKLHKVHPETHTKRQATQHGCLPCLLGVGLRNSNSVRWGKRFFYWADQSSQGRTKIYYTGTLSPMNQPRKRTSFHLSSLSPHSCTSVSTVSSGNPSLVSLDTPQSLHKRICNFFIPGCHYIMFCQKAGIRESIREQQKSYMMQFIMYMLIKHKMRRNSFVWIQEYKWPRPEVHYFAKSIANKKKLTFFSYFLQLQYNFLAQEKSFHGNLICGKKIVRKLFLHIVFKNKQKTEILFLLWHFVPVKMFS